MSHILCPFCEHESLIKGEIILLERVVFLCHECDGLYEIDETGNLGSRHDFDTYMKSFGLTGSWNLVKEVLSD